MPAPIARTADGVLMQYLGTRTMAAPRLAQASLARGDIERAAAQLVTNLEAMVGAGIVHADLSAFNLLWWEDRLWVIDVPQAVDIGVNDHAFEFLERDLANVAGWFAARGVDLDADGLFGELVAAAFGAP